MVIITPDIKRNKNHNKFIILLHLWTKKEHSIKGIPHKIACHEQSFTFFAPLAKSWQAIISQLIKNPTLV